MAKLFQIPVAKSIGGVAFLVAKVPFAAFDDALTFGEWLTGAAGDVLDLAALAQLRGDSPVRAAIHVLLAACLAVDEDGAPRQLTTADVGRMPAQMVLEAVYVVLEENVDFFMQSLAAIRPIQARLVSIGSRSLSS